VDFFMLYKLKNHLPGKTLTQEPLRSGRGVVSLSPPSGLDMRAAISVFVSSEAVLRKSQKYILPYLLLFFFTGPV
jgi:hypothetical protein